ncbi:MAG: Gfo/Idh/MocA family oxidoreductase [Candidatus Sumerlaeota bacterium]|nr:Gfo/Idh/MocA family oxidoreductase [Candidatus Sumerlaeota bacterium]
MKRYRVAMIGVGDVAQTHQTMLSQIPDRCEVVGMFDIDPAQLQWRREQWGCRAFDSLEALLDARPDVCWVMTPAWPRLAILERCFAAGCHCFAEKPLALKVDEAEKAAALAEKAGRRLFVGCNARNIPTTHTLGQLFFQGVLGDLIKAYYLEYIQRDEAVWRKKLQARDIWRLDFAKSGGRIFEFSIHGINFLQWIGGDARWVYGKNDAVSETVRGAGQDDVVSAHVAFARGYGINETIMAPGMRDRFLAGIVGTRGECFLEGKRIRLIVPCEKRDEWIDPMPCANRAVSFFDSLDRGETPLQDGKAAIATTRICCAFNESARTHQAVHLA